MVASSRRHRRRHDASDIVEVVRVGGSLVARDMRDDESEDGIGGESDDADTAQGISEDKRSVCSV